VPKLLPVVGSAPVVACCAPLSAAPLSVGQAKDLAVRLKAVADPARLRLLSLLLASEALEACTCDLTEPLGLSQPTVTHHLKRLLDAGLVTAEPRGVWTYYRVVPEALTAVAAALSPRPGT
jgi:ArsR family transcriptional regulator